MELARAAALRRAADRLDAAAASLDVALEPVRRHRRPDVWRGPAATAFDADLGSHQRQLRDIAAAARHRARALRHQAAELETAARGDRAAVG